MESQQAYIKYCTSSIPLSEIVELIDTMKKLKVLVIGDTIIDEYVYVVPKGRAVKDPILSVEFKSKESYAGGILAIANHTADFVETIHLVTLLGDEKSYSDFVAQSLKENVNVKIFVKENSPTTVKKRMVSHTRNNKMFKIEYINERPISAELSTEICEYLIECLPQYDMVLVGDFGHGFINENIRRTLEQYSKHISINVQSNSANMGFNYNNLYKKFNFITMNEEELRLPLSMRFNPLEAVLTAAQQKTNMDNALVTLGKKGCVFYSAGKTYFAPIVTKNVKDTVGAGDALFSVSSLFAYCKAKESLIPFMANCAGGIAANIIGNKEWISKKGFLSFIEKLYKEVKEVEIDDYFSTVNSTLERLDKATINAFVDLLMEAYRNEKQIYVFGNGGSAATASHFCGDLVKGVSYGLEKRFKVICLNDNIPALMAIANDVSYDDIFSEQLKNFVQEGDLVIGISGSGNSKNVVKALELAKLRKAKTSAICGFSGGKIKEIADLSIHAEVDDMEISEDIHNLIIIHCVKKVMMNELENKNFGDKYMERLSTNGIS